MKRAVESTSFSISQPDFLKHFKLVPTLPKKIEIHDCCVMITGSKCSICKREFKCVTDTQLHVQKKHHYVKRKVDSKLIRVKLKLGPETFYDEKIAKIHLQASGEDAEGVIVRNKKRHHIDEQVPVKLAKLSHHETVADTINRDLLAKGSIPLSSALKDIKSLDANATFKNGRVFKGNPKNYSETEDVVRLQSETPDLDSSSTLAPVSPASSSETILYISDVEQDLSEQYEDVKSKVNASLNDDSDDGEIKVVRTFKGNDFNSIRMKIQQTEGLEAACNAETILKVGLVGTDGVYPEPKKMDHVSMTYSCDASNTTLKDNSTETEMKSQVPLRLELKPEVVDIQIDDTDISDGETVLLGNERGDLEINTRLRDFDDVNVDGDLDTTEDTYELGVDDLEGREEGDQDITIIEVLQLQKPKRSLEDYLEEAVLKYVEECEAVSRGIFGDKNNNDCASLLESNILDRRTRIANLKSSPQYNHHLRAALIRLGITVTPSSLVKEDPTIAGDSVSGSH